MTNKAKIKKAASKKVASTAKKSAPKKSVAKTSPSSRTESKREKKTVEAVVSRSVKGMLTKTKSGLIKVDQMNNDRSGRFKKKEKDQDTVHMYGLGYFEIPSKDSK